MESDRHICDVCRYVDGDKTSKETFFCGDCNAWICYSCKEKPFKRMIAMCLRWLDQDVIK